jgi:linoleoyl-CoA desaturase
MNTIKFVPQDQNQIDFSKELTKRIRVHFKERKISYFGDYRMVLKALFMLCLYISGLLIVVMADLPAWYALLIMVVVGIGEAGIGMGVMHDAAHGSFSRKKWLNSLMTNTMFLLGSNVINWKIQHNVLHHTYPNVHEWDNDVDSKALRLTSHSESHAKAFRYQHLFGPFLYMLMTLLRFVLDFKHLKMYSKMGALSMYKTTYKKAMTALIFTKLIYLSVFFVLPFIFTDYTWWQVLIGFVVMHATASVIMGTVFQMAHIVEDLHEPLPNEEGVIHNQYHVHQLQTTSNFGRKNGLFSWYIGGLNFQVEHHLFPHISHIYYPEISKIVERTAAEFNQPYHCQKSAFTAFRSHLRRLKALGRNEVPPVAV